MKIKAMASTIALSIFIIGCTSNQVINYNYESDKTRGIKLEKIKNSIEDSLVDYKENIGLYYYNLESHDKYSINEDRYFIAASLKKVPQAMMIFDQVRNGDLALDNVIYYTSDDYSAGTGILQNQENIAPMTIKEAIELSIIYSDNIAFNMLERVSGKDINEYIRDICGEDKKPERNTTTAYQQYKIYERMYNMKDIDENYKFLENLLKNTIFHNRLDKYIPKELVAHKIGNFYRYYNDAGIIYVEKPYVLVVLTKDIGELSNKAPLSGDENERCLIDFGEKACQLIANISKSIYDISIES